MLEKPDYKMTLLWPTRAFWADPGLEQEIPPEYA